MIWVLNTIAALSIGTIEPRVARYPVFRRMSSGRERCMANNRFCVGLQIVRVGVPGTAFGQSAKPIGTETAS